MQSEPTVIELLDFEARAELIRLKPPGRTLLSTGTGIWPPDNPSFWRQLTASPVWRWRDDELRASFKYVQDHQSQAPEAYRYAVFRGIIAGGVAAYRYWIEKELDIPVLTDTERHRQAKLASKLRESIEQHGAGIDERNNLIRLLEQIENAPDSGQYPMRKAREPAKRNAVKLVTDKLRTRYGTAPHPVLDDFSIFVSGTEANISRWIR